MTEQSAQKSAGIPFIRSRSFTISAFWLLFALALVGTYLLAQNIQNRGGAAAILLGVGKPHEIELYSDRAEPASIEVHAGEEVVFIVMDGSTHNMAEERTKRGDARLQSGEFGSGESYSLIFQQKGSITFYDRMNTDIRIDITIR